MEVRTLDDPTALHAAAPGGVHPFLHVDPWRSRELHEKLKIEKPLTRGGCWGEEITVNFVEVLVAQLLPYCVVPVGGTSTRELPS